MKLPLKKLLNAKIKVLVDIESDIQDIIDDRETEYDCRSLKWQESGNGDAHLEETEDLREAMMSIREAIDTIDIYSDYSNAKNHYKDANN